MTTSTTEIARLANITAAQRAIEINAPTRIWLAQDQRRGACLLVEEQGYWADQGIVTGLDLARDLLISNISDSYKEWNGFRPHFNFASMSLSELESLMARILPTEEEVEERRAEEAAFEAESARAEVASQEAVLASEEDLWYEVQDRLMAV